MKERKIRKKQDQIREIYESFYTHLDHSRDDKGFYAVSDNQTIWAGFCAGYEVGFEENNQ